MEGVNAYQSPLQLHENEIRKMTNNQAQHTIGLQFQTK